MMCRQYARAFGGERVKCPKPFNRGSRYSIIGAITSEEIIAAMYGEWSTNGDIFLEFLEHSLCPKLEPRHKVILDNVSFHKINAAVELIESTGAEIIYLPPYSPEFSPIENMWSKIKTSLRGFAAKTNDEFQKAIMVAFKAIKSSDLENWFEHCGYKLDQHL
jgi:transposase